jgi:K+-transporting ATPase KdpF subunit
LARTSVNIGGYYERLNLCRDCGSVFRGQRSLRPLLRKTLGALMETIIVGVIALLLFIYLFVAMIRPEKF